MYKCRILERNTRQPQATLTELPNSAISSRLFIEQAIQDNVCHCSLTISTNAVPVLVVSFFVCLVCVCVCVCVCVRAYVRVFGGGTACHAHVCELVLYRLSVLFLLTLPTLIRRHSHHKLQVWMFNLLRDRP